MLTHPTTGANSPSSASAAELCCLAGVSRNSLYRYHPGILKALRQFQCRRPAPRESQANRVSESLCTENAVLLGQIAKLPALVDRYYSAYREASVLVERRDREVASLHKKLDLKPLLLKS